MMNQEPSELMLRRGAVLRWTGLSASEFKKLVAAGIVRGKRLRANGRMFFLRDHIREVVLGKF